MPAFERRRWSVRGGAAYAAQLLRDEGPLGLADRLLSRLGMHRLVVLEQRLDPTVLAAFPARPSSLAELALGEASEADLDALAALRAADHAEVTAALGRPPEPVEALLRRLFAHGDRCFVAREGERVIAALWVARGPTQVRVRYLLCELALSPGDAYVYDVFTAPERRGRGVVTALYAHVALALAASGSERAVMLVRVHNTANLRAAARAGYARLGILACIAAGGRMLHLGDALPMRPWPRG